MFILKEADESIDTLCGKIHAWPHPDVRLQGLPALSPSHSALQLLCNTLPVTL